MTTVGHFRAEFSGLRMGDKCVIRTQRGVEAGEGIRDAAPFLELLRDSTVIAKTRHSDTELRWSARVNGLPQVGPLVERFVRNEEVRSSNLLCSTACGRAGFPLTPRGFQFDRYCTGR